MSLALIRPFVPTKDFTWMNEKDRRARRYARRRAE